MSPYDSLVGQSFHRDGVRFTIIECEGSKVTAAADGGEGGESVTLPLVDVIDALEVTEEVTVTELPRQDRDSA